MQTKVRLAAVLLSGIALYAQNQNPPATDPPASAPPAAVQAPLLKRRLP